MHYAYLSPTLKQDQIDFITQTIKTFDGEIIATDDQSDLIITGNVDLLKNKQTKPFSITFICYKLMAQEGINPFTFQFQISYMNIFLYPKSFNFYKLNTNKAEQCKNLVLSMGGTIST